jgi:hypothetical protein
MQRRIRNIAVSISTVLMVLAVLDGGAQLWRSHQFWYKRLDSTQPPRSRWWQVAGRGGWISFAFGTTSWNAEPVYAGYPRSGPGSYFGPAERSLGLSGAFAAAHWFSHTQNRAPDIHTSGDDYRVVSVPNWFAVLLFAIAPARVWHVRRRVAQRARTGHCVACGYDLRASPERCPECGALSEAGHAAAA